MLDWQFFLLLLSNGVLIGLMYSLIALGFVLVYKATDALNFAQGEFVMIAGFAVAAGLTAYGAPLWLALGGTLAAMVALGFGLERTVLRPLLGRPIVAILMATIGLAAVLRGLGPLVWGAGTKALPLPVPDEPVLLGPLVISPIQLVGAAVSLLFLGGFGWFFLRSRQGIAMRAVADSQQVADHVSQRRHRSDRRQEPLELGLPPLGLSGCAVPHRRRPHLVRDRSQGDESRCPPPQPRCAPAAQRAGAAAGRRPGDAHPHQPV